MYQPKLHEKKSIPRGRQRDQQQRTPSLVTQAPAGGVILSFAQARKTEAEARLQAFIKSPLAWIQENQPLRKAALLEALDIRPGIDAEYEHKIQSWKRSKTKGVKI
jgi:hypothetical protein